MGALTQNSIKVELEIECALDTGQLSDMEWFMLSGGTPRKERSYRRNSKPQAWKFVDLCAWIGRKVVSVAKLFFPFVFKAFVRIN